MNKRVFGFILGVCMIVCLVACGHDTAQKKTLIEGANKSISQAKSVEADVTLECELSVESSKQSKKIPVKLTSQIQIGNNIAKFDGKLAVMEKEETFQLYAKFNKNEVKLYYKQGATGKWKISTEKLDENMDLSIHDINLVSFCDQLEVESKIVKRNDEDCYHLSGEMNLSSNSSFMKDFKQGFEAASNGIKLSDLEVEGGAPNLDLYVTKEGKKLQSVVFTMGDIDFSKVIKYFTAMNVKAGIQGLKVQLNIKGLNSVDQLDIPNVAFEQ
ncbi:hypothetical protein lbkm_4004 [Lachnospiraceae bacterium KM106-2]|nr:hypothetical protein lbkm_4004 [Lachnospiraceae bacterium KM106-2]